MVTRFPHDPEVRGDGRRVVCREPCEPQRSRRYGKAEAEIDPFCSTRCCRQWYRVPTDAAKLPSVTRPA